METKTISINGQKFQFEHRATGWKCVTKVGVMTPTLFPKETLAEEIAAVKRSLR